MKAFDQLVLVNYCHPGCVPLKNIMRLPEAQAFQLAQRLAEEHPETTAFYRFADFANYYALRKAQDAALYQRFLLLGGRPEEAHPLSFVVEGSAYLRGWFGNGPETQLLLKDIAPWHISFTVGDSGAAFQKNGTVELLDVNGLRRLLEENGGSLAQVLLHTGYHYVEAQLWCDAYLKQA
ncbi:MAG: hypothetical protein K2P33_12095 [Acutalibacter sp.]|nr:hypothetical protein [Acutalibacter sp.]